MTASSEPELPEVTFEADPREPQQERLLAALLDARRRLTQIVQRGKAENQQIIEACHGCLSRANLEAKKHRFVAWDCLHQFDAEFLRALTPAERQARWCALNAEAADKLKEWRADAAACFAGLVEGDRKRAQGDTNQRDETIGHGGTTTVEAAKTSSQEKSGVPLHLLSELHAQLVTVSQNRQHKIELYQKESLPQVRGWLLIVLITAAVATAALLYAGDRLEGFADLLPWGQSLGLGMLAGALGGVISMAFSIGRADLKAKIPDLRLSRLVTRIRPLLGATVAIPIAMLVKAGFVKVAGFEGLVAIAAFCFLGGFSERWFLGLLERFEGATK